MPKREFFFAIFSMPMMARPVPGLRRLAVVGLLLGAACGGKGAAVPSASTRFVDVAREAGLVEPHVAGRSGSHFMPEIMGSGCALFDFDGDGWLDIYLACGKFLDEGSRTSAPARGRLYRNASTRAADGTIAWRFVDVTAASGIPTNEYGIGVAAGDYDNDGWVDLYLANYGANQLLKNLGNGTFRDVTDEAGAGEGRWSSGASFLDYDGDGGLDLYVTNYLDAHPGNHQVCPTPAGEPDYCGPVTYKPLHDRLLRNRGDGRFEDVSFSAGILAEAGSSLGAVAADVDDDGRLDILVSNDKMPNFLWLGQADGTFVESAVAAGCAVDENGMAGAGMGVDAADVDGDGDEDLIFAHLAGETNTFYRNLGGIFEDQSVASGLGPPSRPFTAFGAVFFDFDLDGWLDFATVNGHVHRLPELAEAGDPFPYHQRNQLYRNVGDGRFAEVLPAEAGPGFEVSAAHRGLAVGDVDDDGDLDLLITRTDAVPSLLINQRPRDRRWLGLRLRLAQGRDAFGARVTLAEKGLPLQVRRVRTDGSYGSARDPRLLFARAGEGPAAVEVRWPSGRRERFAGLAAGRYHDLREGSGEPAVPESGR